MCVRIDLIWKEDDLLKGRENWRRWAPACAGSAAVGHSGDVTILQLASLATLTKCVKAMLSVNITVISEDI